MPLWHHSFFIGALSPFLGPQTGSAGVSELNRRDLTVFDVANLLSQVRFSIMSSIFIIFYLHRQQGARCFYYK